MFKICDLCSQNCTKNYSKINSILAREKKSTIIINFFIIHNIFAKTNELIIRMSF